MWSISRVVSIIALAIGLLMFFSASSAPQQAAAASGALLLIVGFYCIARASDKITEENDKAKQKKTVDNQ